jgi:tRNA threonylcarbamoyladenosine biosynthesis protein TsaE
MIYFILILPIKKRTEALDMGAEDLWPGNWRFIEWQSKSLNLIPEEHSSITIELLLMKTIVTFTLIQFHEHN